MRIKAATALAVMVLAGLSASGARSDDGWFVVSYSRQITAADRAALDASGARAVLYRPESSYVAWLTTSAREHVARLPHVDAVRRLTPAEKVAPALEHHRTGVLSIEAAAADADALLARVGEIAPIVRAHAATPDRSLVSLTVRAAEHRAVDLASLPDVLSVGPGAERIELLDESSSQIVAGNIQAGKPVTGYRSFLAGHGVDGSGVTIAIADSGIDDTHPDLAGRVVARTDFTALPDVRDSDGHGTHVAGIAAGSGQGIPFGADPNGFVYGQGVAPGATMVDVGVLGILEEILGMDRFPPFESATRYAVRNGAIGWNASWGSGEGTNVGYTSAARTFDMLARDADWETPGPQPFILVFAAGNAGTTGIGAPSEAKSLISVGATLAARAGTIDAIASFSSRGPARDGRVAPTVVAPGDTVVSTRSLVGSVLCNAPPRDAAPFAAFYGVCSGTSMAAPHVTGATALIAQWWRRTHGGATPSLAMTKALLVNSATDLRLPDVPNKTEGWGRVNLSALLGGTGTLVAEDQTVVLEDVGQAHTVRVAPADPSRPMKVTLAWSDAPAMPNAAKALVNDLDLTVTAPGGAVYRGNVLSGGASVPGGSPNRVDVVENVFLRAPEAGAYTVEVRAANLPGDGLSWTGDATDQDFALVVSNAVAV